MSATVNPMASTPGLETIAAELRARGIEVPDAPQRLDSYDARIRFFSSRRLMVFSCLIC